MMETNMRDSLATETKKNSGSPTQYSFIVGAKEMALNGPLNLLLLCTPIALISYGAGWSDAVTFVFSLIALAPLAERLGFVTEQLAIHTNQTIGGLLNATFGNATEIIVAIAALSKGLYRLVQLSLLGSILSNMLLVLGCAFFFGGLRHKEQRFGKISSQVNASLLMLSTMGILLPTVLTNSGQESNLGQLGFSRFTSLVLFVCYFGFLYFQLRTHTHLYDDTPQPDHGSLHSGSVSSSNNNLIDVESNKNPLTKGLIANDSMNEKKEESTAEESDDEDEDILGFNYAIFWLAVITVLIAFLSDAISESIQDAASSCGISAIFISAIILPIVGNAAEHAGAVMFAMKGKLDMSLGVAIGSSTQIALMVLPFLVIIGWMGGYDLSLNFGTFEACTLFLSVVAVTFAIKDGTSNWLIGAALVAAYFVIAGGFWAHVDDDLTSQP